MKKILLFGALIAFLSSCNYKHISPSGVVITEDRELGSFSSVDVSHGLTLVIEMTETESVVVTADDNLMEYIETYVKDERLMIGVARGVSFGWRATVKVNVKADDMGGVEASGGATVRFTNKLATDKLYIDLSGGSQLEAEVDAGFIDAGSSGGSDLKLGGYCEEIKLDCSGGGSTRGYSLSADNAILDLSGGSSAQLTVNKTLDVKVSGGGYVYYKGDAVITNISTSGGGKVEKKD